MFPFVMKFLPGFAWKHVVLPPSLDDFARKVRWFQVHPGAGSSDPKLRSFWRLGWKLRQPRHWVRDKPSDFAMKLTSESGSGNVQSRFTDFS